MGMVELERLAALSRSQLHEALLNILQSQSPASGVNLSMATRATMGKRGISQLEGAKGTLDIASDLATLVLGRMRATLSELAQAHAMKAEAMARATAAEAISADAVSLAEERVAAQTAELEASTAAAVAAAEEASVKARAAEARAAAAEAARATAMRELEETRASASSSERAREDSEARRQALAEQVERERAVLARLAAENLLFVKRLQQVTHSRSPRNAPAAATTPSPPPPHVVTPPHAPKSQPKSCCAGLARRPCAGVECREAHCPAPALCGCAFSHPSQAESERARAERERTELQTRWREQTEEWFRRATDELQSQLLTDWGASGAVESELQAARDESTAAAAQHEREAAAAADREEALRSELEAKESELADITAQLLGVRERHGLLQAEAKRRERDEATMRAQLDVARAQLAEVRGNDAVVRAASEEAKAEAARLRERALRDEHSATTLRESLRAAEEKLRVTQAVYERARGEVAAEHGALLEAEAKLGILTQDSERLRERLHAAEQEKSVIMRSMVSSVAAAPTPVSPVA